MQTTSETACFLLHAIMCVIFPLGCLVCELLVSCMACGGKGYVYGHRSHSYVSASNEHLEHSSHTHIALYGGRWIHAIKLVLGLC